MLGEDHSACPQSLFFEKPHPNRVSDCEAVGTNRIGGRRRRSAGDRDRGLPIIVSAAVAAAIKCAEPKLSLWDAPSDYYIHVATKPRE